MQFLLERGDSCPGRTAYCSALEFSRWSILKLLLGSRVGAQSTKGDTALHFAAHIGDEKVMQLLLANGDDASAPDEDGLRPLHYVAGAVSLHLKVYDDWVKKRVDLDKSHIGIIGMLLEKGACVSETDRFGLTAIDYAVRLDRESIVQCLKQMLDEE